MTGRKRAGFTLVELLVVIVIIGMLMALLLPAVLRARETARRGKCQHNQHEISLAALHYDVAEGHLPGVINGLGSPIAPGVAGANGVTWPLSWAVALLPNMGREDVWSNWKLYVTGQGSANPLCTVNMPQYVCPSTDVVNAGLNYVANCGSLDSAFMGSGPVQTVNEVTAGTILDYYNVPAMPRMTASNIKDGASVTLMFSENLQTGNWMGGPINVTGVSVTPNPNPWNGVVWYNLVGMFWTASPSIWSASPSPSTGYGINVGRTDQNFPVSVSDFSHARPSSNHPGVVVVSYCDGHQDILSEDIAYIVYAQLMAPDDASAGLPPMTTPPSTP